MTKTINTIDAHAVRQLAEVLGDTGLAEVEYETQDFKIRIVRALSGGHAVPASSSVGAAPVVVSVPVVQGDAPATTVAPENHPGVVLAPMVGVTYCSAEPGTPPFVQVGGSVTEGQTLLLIEAMKTFNPVKAPHSGKVTAILCKDSQPVEYGQPLMIIE